MILMRINLMLEKKRNLEIQKIRYCSGDGGGDGDDDGDDNGALDNVRVIRTIFDAVMKTPTVNMMMMVMMNVTMVL